MKIKQLLLGLCFSLFLVVPIFYLSTIVHADVDESKWTNLTQEKKEWLKKSAQASQSVSAEKGIYASIQIAQAILESGWGQSGLAKQDHNLFGIKGDYQGQSSKWATNEDDGSGNLYGIMADFRKYPSDKESYADNGDLLLSQGGTNPKVASKILEGEEGKLYSCAWKKYAETYERAAKCLEGSYATDTTYASQLKTLIDGYDLTQFDTEGIPDTDTNSGKKEETVKQSKFVGEEAWKNKAVNFQNNTYQSTLKGIGNGSTGFINTAFILGLNKTSQNILDIAYIGMLFITIGLFLFMFLATMVYLVILPNGLGGYKLMDIFEKTTGLDSAVNKHTTIDLISRLLLTTLVVACLYANLLPIIISGFIQLFLMVIGIFV